MSALFVSSLAAPVLAAGLHAAMAVDVADLRRIGDDLAARFERDFDAVIRPALPAP